MIANANIGAPCTMSVCLYDVRMLTHVHYAFHFRRGKKRYAETVHRAVKATGPDKWAKAQTSGP